MEDIKARYQRNIGALSYEDVKKLNESKICVVGCGGLGGFIIENLGRIGVHTITAIDCDVFEESNLNRQLLSQDNLIGTSKADAAKIRMSLINPNVNLNPIEMFIDYNNGGEILKGHDVIIDAVDNAKTKIMLQRICEELSIPFVHGGIGGWYGQVATILPGDRTLDYVYKDIDYTNKINIGNLPFVASAIASLQCSEAIKILTGKEDILSGRMIYFNFLDYSMDIIEIKK